MRDTVEITRWVQLIGGLRFDRFEMAATDQNTGAFRTRTDNLTSPQAAVIVKPINNLSVYTSYSVSYLPSSGDQFSSLTQGTLILAPQKFVNTEVGLKWNINPKLLFSTAIYNLDRTTSRFRIRPRRPARASHFQMAPLKSVAMKRAWPDMSPLPGNPRSVTPTPTPGSRMI
ncbi:MAG: TonB-dependent receptor [Bradyrhizobium sp.]